MTIAPWSLSSLPRCVTTLPRWRHYEYPFARLVRIHFRFQNPRGIAGAAARGFEPTNGYAWLCAIWGRPGMDQNPAQDRIELPGPRDRLRRENYAECGSRCFVQR